MKEYSIIYFRGMLNGEKVLRDLMIIEFLVNKKMPFIFNHQLSAFLYGKRGKNELGPKNGYQTSGWLDVMSFLHSPELYPDCTVVKVNSFDIPKVYKGIRDELRKAIDRKINIKGR